MMEEIMSNFVCEECGSDKVYDLLWLSANNTGEIIEGPGRTWCDGCKTEGIHIMNSSCYLAKQTPTVTP